MLFAAKIIGMAKHTSTTDPEAFGHILFVYESKQKRLKVLADYFDQGLRNEELCILVTPESSEEIIQDLLSAGLDVREAVKNNDLRIFEMNEAYLPNGKFVGNYMLTNVVNYIVDAKARGYNGVRTAGEMAWLFDHPEFLEAASKYEQNVNKLNKVSPEFTGLCMYPVREGTSDIIDKALETHPSFIHDGTMETNPFNKPSPLSA